MGGPAWAGVARHQLQHHDQRPAGHHHKHADHSINSIAIATTQLTITLHTTGFFTSASIDCQGACRSRVRSEQPTTHLPKLNAPDRLRL